MERQLEINAQPLDCTRNLELVCTAGIGTKGCWRLCLQAVGRIPFVLSSMKSLELVDFPFHWLYVPVSPLSTMRAALGLSIGCPNNDGDVTMKAFRAIETLVVRSTIGFIHYEPLHILLAYFFQNVRKLICQEPDEQCSFLVPCVVPPTLPDDIIPLPQLCSFELLYPSKDIYTLLLHGPHYLRNIQYLVLDDGPCFAGEFRSYDILREVGQQLKSLRLNLDAVAKSISELNLKNQGFSATQLSSVAASELQLWDLSQNSNLTTLVLHTRYDRSPRRRCSAASAAWIIELPNVIDTPRLRNLILLIERKVEGPTAQSNKDVGIIGPLCELGKCKNNSLFERLEEYWVMYKPAYENQPVIEGVSNLIVEECILGLFGLGAMAVEGEVVMPKVKVVKSIDGILDGFD
jgi:hypothetical protein